MASWQFFRLNIAFPLILVLLFLLDGNLMASLGNFLLRGSLHAVPMLTLIWFFYAIQFGVMDKMPFYVYVVIIGVLYDIFYTGIFGTYTLSFLGACFVMERLQPYFDSRMMSGLLLFLIGMLVYLAATYFAGKIIGVGHESHLAFFIFLLLPTSVLNLVLAAIFYYPGWSLLQRLG
ncbi:rod shape-determining protein MreD [Fructobacillus sp. M2-14]|uniref:Rod shape-determining protein MreD n=1 Tax=Fructobacillus broussonetiae TaxID=2713173 RepID=A0ABS5QYQ3_9LACO|nr:rod shape-determining protein MreD [Fructobacillus broussonetiae]MBS9338316.1 rod shape-determining protein MreD [Fructobacillus broussonetiae]